MSLAMRSALCALALSSCIPEHDPTLCSHGAAQCGDRCVSLALDPSNCGRCGETCAAGDVCRAGSCAPPCGDGLDSCDGACVALGSDPAHCGECHAACVQNLVCVEGTCEEDCFGGSARCGDRCIDPASDPAHCGGCGNACDAGGACIAGKCVAACGAGLSCGGQCVDGTTDPANCGACGHACVGGRTCADAQCQPYCGNAPCAACETWWALDAGPVNAHPTTLFHGVKAIATAADGRVFVAIDFQGEIQLGGTELTSAGLTDIAVAELSSTGSVIWATQIGGPSTERAYALVLLDDSTLVLGADFGSKPLAFGAQLLQAVGTVDGLVAVLSTAGVPKWAARVASTGPDRVQSVAASPDGIIIAGTYGADAILAAPTGKTVSLSPHAGEDDAFLARLDAKSGEPIWSTCFGALKKDAIADIAVTGGKVFVTGSFERRVSVPPDPTPDDPSVTVSLGDIKLTHDDRIGAIVGAFAETDGAALWASVFGYDDSNPTKPNAAQTFGSALAVAPDNNLWVALRDSAYLTLGQDQLVKYEGWDVALLRLDPSGAVIGGWPMGGKGVDMPTDLAIDETGRMLLSGTFTADMKFTELAGDSQTKLESEGVNDIWLVSLDPPLDLASPPGLRCARSFGDPAPQAPTSLSVRQSAALLAGSFMGTIDLGGSAPFTSAAGTHGFVAAFGF